MKNDAGDFFVEEDCGIELWPCGVGEWERFDWKIDRIFIGFSDIFPEIRLILRGERF